MHGSNALIGDKRVRRGLRWPRTWKGWAALIYLSLLLISHAVRLSRHSDSLSGDGDSVEVQEVVGDRRLARDVHVSYQDFPAESGRDRPAVILLHGSPGHKEDFRKLAPELSRDSRVITVDLPGFGHSTRDVPDYSIRAHAGYVLQLMDRLGIERAHIIGFSMGGGVALNVADLAPERVASLVMLSAIGVQEMELLGDYHLNHGLHGAQVALLWLLREGVPGEGVLWTSMLDLSYARNFYDTDQRPLRDILSRVETPMLILHGRSDVLVPVQAALEHQRLVPQSELTLFDDNHFMVFTGAPMLSRPISEFLGRVDRGQATTRGNADPLRVAASLRPFDSSTVPKAMGVTAFVLALLLAAATLISEDLTCIAAGVMVAQGRVDLGLAAVACFIGIFAGDILLFLAGRYLGRAGLTRAPLKWFVTPADVDRGSAWFNRRGMAVIAASRFVPGMRLPTYFAAGLLRTRLARFTLYFMIAAAVWTPLLVGLSSVLGAEAIKFALLARQSAFVQVLTAGVVLLVCARLAIGLSTHRGRRLMVSRWRRLTRWEFWPPWAFYPPVACYVLWLGITHRSLTLFTAANPAMPASGFIGESKFEILQGLAGSSEFVARASLITASLDIEVRVEAVRRFMSESLFDFPVVLKPNEGQRGAGVAVIRSPAELEGYLRRMTPATSATIVQEYVPGEEFGVFYYRKPDEPRGHIFSVTDKRFPVVVGDGASTLETLILEDPRAVCMARFYLDANAARLSTVPPRGESVQLVELGTHCRGAVFLDGSWVKTDEMETAIDRISLGYSGFYFGRFDIRTPSVDDFKAGRNFKIIELNGVTSEATHIYDPKNSLFEAYRVLFAQWRLAFEIGELNRGRGVEPAPVRRLIKMLIDYRSRSRSNQ